MELNVITQLLSNVAFPIVMCLLLYKYMEKQDEQHRQEMDKISESLNNNTQALVRLTAQLEKEGNDGK